MVGYALGNRSSVEEDILVLGEENESVVTYSAALKFVLTQECLASCKMCALHRKESMAVPYSTIKTTKEARSIGCREVIYKANPRPDQYPKIRANLELWGFDSYLDYLYTVCELGFLEGLVPVIDLGFLTPEEIKSLSEIAAMAYVPFITMEDYIHEAKLGLSKETRVERRYRNLVWASKLSVPIRTGYMVGGNTSVRDYASWIDKIAQLDQDYGMIHEVVLEPYRDNEYVTGKRHKKPSHEDMLAAYQTVREKLPDHIPVTVPLHLTENILDYIKLGMRDLGSVISIDNAIVQQGGPFDWDGLESDLAAMGLTLQQRFPIGREFIKEERYSKKLGQVFDAYKYKIRKDIQEKIKEAKG